MSMHPLDPNDEVRECPGCLDCTRASFLPGSIMDESPRCNAIGQLGDPDAPRVIEVRQGALFYSYRIRHSQAVAALMGREWPRLWEGRWHTEPEALAAARKALGGGK